MATITRVQDQSAFVLHRYDWSESSLILEVWTRDFGRIAVVAKGAKKPSSQFRPILLPLQALNIAWRGDSEVRTLRAATWVGGYVMPTGEALLTGLYLNELLLRMLARDDAHPRLFDLYAQATQALATRDTQTSNLALLVRCFELLLLRELGVLPDLSIEGASLLPVQPTALYTLHPEMGLLAVDPVDTNNQAITGAQWLLMYQAAQAPSTDGSAHYEWQQVMQACTGLSAKLRGQLRLLLQSHSGVRVFKTRQMWLDVNAMGSQSLGPVAVPVGVIAL
jgi:DNA repair protein RecO (recombination protein O)